MKFTTSSHVLAWVLIAVASAEAARAAEATEAAATPGGQSQIQVQVQADGVQVQADGDGTVVTKTIVVRIGPDGKIEIKDAIPGDVKQKVTEARETAERQAAEIQQDVKRKIAAAEEQAREATEREQKPLQGQQATGFGMQGSITVIGPDGVQRTQTFGGDGAPMPGLQQLLEKSLEAAGADLPDEVRQKLGKAFRRQGQDEAGEQGQMQPANAAKDVSRKLDLILERLEKLEQALHSLQATRPAEKP